MSYSTGEFWAIGQRCGHSLHEISYRGCFKPELAGFFIDRFTSAGEVVYDPFMGRGTTPLEAALRGRIAMGSDANPLCEMLAAPRLDPPSIQEISRWLNEFDWNSATDTPAEVLAFFHPETLRQLVLLRTALLQSPLGKTGRWIRMVALSRLTGHSPSFSLSAHFHRIKPSRSPPSSRSTSATIWLLPRAMLLRSF